MKTKFAVLWLFLIVSLLAQKTEAKHSLIVQTPSKWSFEYKGDSNLEFYTFTRKVNGFELLMFSRLPVPLSTREMRNYIDSMAKGFVIEVKNNNLELVTTDYKLDEIKGDFYSGYSVAFDLSTGITQTMFMVSDGDEKWTGQFTGSLKGWSEALSILKTLKKTPLE